MTELDAQRLRLLLGGRHGQHVIREFNPDDVKTVVAYFGFPGQNITSA